MLPVPTDPQSPATPQLRTRGGKHAMRPLGKTGQPLRVKGKLVAALKAIVWEGQELDQAAKTAGLTTYAVRLALDRPHVIAFLKAEREVFRQHVSAQNIHHAKQLRDTSRNAMAKLGAMRFIEGIADEQTTGGERRSPGVVVQIVSSGETNVTLKTDESAPE